MRYWGTESKVSRTGARSRVGRKGAKRPEPSRSKVAAGGSVQPFLRQFYRHPAVMGGPVQRFFIFLILAGLLYAFVLGDGGAIRIAILRHQRGQVDQSITELKQSVALLEKEIIRLEKDAFYIEKIGRERFGYARPGEQVFKIVPEEGAKTR
jgi:cell division protein FtsB